MSKEKLSTQPYRGTRDFFPPEMQKLNYIFKVWRQICERFGYGEYLGPLLESWDLYATKNVSGEEIVNKQLYWFEDQGGRKIAIRPEMTPTVSRMIAQKAQELPKPIRWFSIANFMRYERPQKGRVREFFQLNIDVFGEPGIAADAELIEAAIEMMRGFGADENMFEIKINNRKLANYLLSQKMQIAEEKYKAVTRIIDRMGKQDRKDSIDQFEELELNVGQIDGLLKLPEMSLTEVDQLKGENDGAREIIDLFDLLAERDLSVFVRFDASLMRGLDYYTGNVFEQFDLTPNNKRSMFGGGRYDGLINLFGGAPMAANGFAPGDVTTLDFLENWQLLPEFDAPAQVLVTIFEERYRRHAWEAARDLRKAGVNTELYLKTGDSVSAQLNYADRRKIMNVIIIGPGEVDSQNVVWKRLDSGEQDVMPLSKVISELTEKD